jgi:hypothetical protein
MPKDAHNKAAEHHENAAQSIALRPNITEKTTT